MADLVSQHNWLASRLFFAGRCWIGFQKRRCELVCLCSVPIAKTGLAGEGLACVFKPAWMVVYADGLLPSSESVELAWAAETSLSCRFGNCCSGSRPKSQITKNCDLRYHVVQTESHGRGHCV